jgi:hypothetical protein
MNILILFISLALVLTIFFWRLKISASRKKTVFQLYAVRDNLISLVAEEKLNEESPVFKYYYRRVSRLLTLVPNVGIDCFLKEFLHLQHDRSFNISLSNAHKSADKMMILVEEMNDEEISKVIADFYSSAKTLMLVHSSILKILYLVFKNIAWSGVDRIVSKKQEQQLELVKFADNEAIRFGRLSHIHAV